MKCAKCGTELPEGAAFCLKCGTPRKEGRMFCAKCGTEMPEGAAFCLKCGTPRVGKAAKAPGISLGERLERWSGIQGLLIALGGGLIIVGAFLPWVPAMMGALLGIEVSSGAVVSLTGLLALAAWGLTLGRADGILGKAVIFLAALGLALVLQFLYVVLKNDIGMVIGFIVSLVGMLLITAGAALDLVIAARKPAAPEKKLKF